MTLPSEGNHQTTKRPMSTLPSSVSFSTPQGAKFATKKRQLLERTKNSMKCLLVLSSV
uniref:Uncharacterized protein n=1 Tax=Romanomermis culicivorax TaxID=13658 RepID=A0A915JII1_ROMCU